MCLCSPRFRFIHWNSPFFSLHLGPQHFPGSNQSIASSQTHITDGLKFDIFKHDELTSFNVFCLHWVRESWFLLVSWVVGFAPLPLKVMKGWNEWWLGYWVLLHQLLLVLHMFRRLRWFVGLNQKNWSTKRLVNVEQPGPARPNQLPVLDAVHEVAIYIHRFHNLDLFEQG